ncbi:MAG: AI-2E family transporter [Mesorhizobium sp.]|nr:AI-2E family transporter [Mesorhizobium sp.]MBL8578574.1 AI-2E family transporter [Mesorhizobium sp.]
MRKTTIEGVSFVTAVVLVTAAFVWLLLPYYGAILWATILAILFRPLYRRLFHRFGGANIAAGLSLLACICIVVLPGSIVLASLAQEATSLYQRIDTREFDVSSMLQQIYDALPTFVINGLQSLGLGDISEIQNSLTSFMGQLAQAFAARAVIIGQGTLQFVVSLGVMLYLLFFLFRDGHSLALAIRRASPLKDRYTDQIFAKFASVVRATVKGNVIIAIIQGTIGGVMFWLIGIEAGLLWGVLMALLSLLPAVGAALVWGPVAGFLLLSGEYGKGLALLAVGTLVIGMVDNLLRPQLVGKDLRLPDYVILISTVGGISLFGINGFVIGPLIAALFVAVWSLFSDDQTIA